ncbi:hypothetical protein Tco_1337353 [Tanacetum coccineum]
MGTVRFGNDHFAAITGYRDYVHGNVTICHVYYVEGLGHNLFSVGQFCDGDLEVAFRSKTCYVRNLEGDDLLTGAHDLNLYTISISDMTASSPVVDRVERLVSFAWFGGVVGRRFWVLVVEAQDWGGSGQLSSSCVEKMGVYGRYGGGSDVKLEWTG